MHGPVSTSCQPFLIVLELRSSSVVLKYTGEAYFQAMLTTQLCIYFDQLEIATPACRTACCGLQTHDSGRTADSDSSFSTLRYSITTRPRPPPAAPSGAHLAAESSHRRPNSHLMTEPMHVCAPYVMRAGWDSPFGAPTKVFFSAYFFTYPVIPVDRVEIAGDTIESTSSR